MDTPIFMRGNLVADPRQEVVADGLRLTKFRIASSRRRFDEATNTWITTETVFMSVFCWRQMGDNVLQSLRKGDSVMVYGKLRFSEYDDSHGGPRRQSYEIEAASVGPDLYRYTAQLGRPLRELPDASVPDQPATPATEGLPEQVESAA